MKKVFGIILSVTVLGMLLTGCYHHKCCKKEGHCAVSYKAEDKSE